MAEPGRELQAARAVAVASLVTGGIFVAVALASSQSECTTTTRALAAVGMAVLAFGVGLLLAAPGLYLPDPSPARRFAQVALPVGLVAVLAPAAAALTVQALPADDDPVVASAPVTAVGDPTATTVPAQWPPAPTVLGGANSNIDQDLAGTARQELAGTATTVAPADGGQTHIHTGDTVPGEGDEQWANQVQSELGGAVQQALAGDQAAPTTAPAADPVTPSSVAPDAFAGDELLDHGHGSVPELPLDAATRVQLSEQMVQARDVSSRFPTVADAEAAGYRMVTGYVPLIGAHYVKWGAMDGTFDIGEPEMLLYDGTEPDSRIVGLSYYVFSGTEPDGFAGPNDHWHQHRGLCLRGLVVVGGEKLTEAECAARGGSKVDGANGWMVHAWVVPGWESPEGVFSPQHQGLV